MRLFNFSKQLILASCYILLALPSATLQGKTYKIDTEKVIYQLYHNLNANPTSDVTSRVEWISSQFLGKPYLLGALGEGEDGRYDQFPLYRMDAFDCETFVDTVLALALSNDSKQFKDCINQIRYQNGQVSFINRNHFTCLDWNQHNQQKGFIKDITTTILNQRKQSVAKYAHALINKPAWYAHMPMTIIRLNTPSPVEQATRLNALKREGNQLQLATSIVPYIPFSVLFDKNGKPNKYLFNQIPNAAIIEIVRPNWDLTKEIGTHLNVSHLGFVIRKQDILFFRQASSTYNSVVDIPFIDYLAAARKSPTIKGINIQTVVISPKD